MNIFEIKKEYQKQKEKSEIILDKINSIENYQGSIDDLKKEIKILKDDCSVHIDVFRQSILYSSKNKTTISFIPKKLEYRGEKAVSETIINFAISMREELIKSYEEYLKQLKEELNKIVL
jgi:phage host-nuclease inhibitor protein Gam